jgi:hypothetical protein
MTIMAIFEVIERHHQPVMLALFAIVLFFATACVLHDLIPVCHWIFQCDHRMH